MAEENGQETSEDRRSQLATADASGAIRNRRAIHGFSLVAAEVVAAKQLQVLNEIKKKKMPGRWRSLPHTRRRQRTSIFAS